VVYSKEQQSLAYVPSQVSIEESRAFPKERAVVITTLAILIFAALSVGGVLVIVGTLKKNRWGINTDRLICPNCGNPLVRVRKPKTTAQVFWGGHVRQVRD
jgi:hypothetical protein